MSLLKEIKILIKSLRQVLTAAFISQMTLYQLRFNILKKEIKVSKHFLLYN